MERVVFVDGQTLTSADVVAVACDGAYVELAKDAIPRIELSRKEIEKILSNGETVYGVNTGFGSLCDVRINTDQLSQLQVNLIRSHACGLGKAMSKEEVRGMMLLRANSLAKGHSGVRVEVIEKILEFLNQDIIPYVPRIGSLGASGDLAPLAHSALSIIGEGQIILDNGDQVPTTDVLKKHNILPLMLEAKEGLSLINGTSQMLSWLCLSERMLIGIFKLADIIYCTSLESIQGTIAPADERVHNSRPHPGQKIVAERIRNIMMNSEILENHANCDKVQDPYSFRCVPQVHGPANEWLSKLQNIIDIEINSATDNPLIFPENESSGKSTVISQGNFHGEILAMIADSMSIACFELGTMSERRIDYILDSSRSNLPPFLANKSGLESGLMIVQYAAASSLSQMNSLAKPDVTFNVSTSANQEDHVSMGATSCYNLLIATRRLSEIFSCELLVASEALEHQSLTPGQYVTHLYKLVRERIAPLDGDRSLSAELNELATAIQSGEIINLIEAELGVLENL